VTPMAPAEDAPQLVAPNGLPVRERHAHFEPGIADVVLTQDGGSMMPGAVTENAFKSVLPDLQQALGGGAAVYSVPANRDDAFCGASTGHKLSPTHSESGSRTVTPVSHSSPISPRSIRARSSTLSFVEHEAYGAAPLAGCSERLQEWVLSVWFETFFAGVILANCVFMAFEAQYNGLHAGFVVGYTDYDTKAVHAWPCADIAFEVLELAFGIMYTLELVAKMVGLRRGFCTDIWNAVDFCIVASWMVSSISKNSLPLPPFLLRCTRLVRVLRLLRLVRTINGFDALYLMTTAMKGSFVSLLWSVLILVLVQMMLALLLQVMVEDYISNRSMEHHKRMEVFQFFGTFARTMLTMFEITLGNWMPPCRALVENVSEWYMLFFVLHKLLIGFSVVGVITGVFIQETFKVATTDDKIMVMQRERAVRAHTKKMKALFEHADSSGDGFLDKNEFKSVMALPSVRTWLAAMELDVDDVDHLFTLIDDGDEMLSAQELVQGVARLKGTARSIDVATMAHKQDQIQEILQQLHSMLNEKR